MKIVVSPALHRALEQSLHRCEQIAHDGLLEMGSEWLRHAQQGARTADYAGSMAVSDLGVGQSVLVGSKSPLGAILERGRRPGSPPPVRSIQKRSLSGHDAAKAAKTVGERGTRGRWVVRKARQAVYDSGAQQDIARRTLQRITNLGGGDGIG